MIENRKFHIKTFGCQMNVYDSGRIFDLLINSGYVFSDKVIDSDVIILNTCYIREKASEKIFSELGRIKNSLSKKYKHFGKTRIDYRPIFIIVGCVAKAEGENILKRIPYVDAVLSASEYYLIPEIINELTNNPEKKIVNIELNGTKKFDYLVDIAPAATDFSSFVAIQEGCDKFCTYCVVPNTRGREVSRSVDSIIKEIKSLNNGKTVELTLLGQNVSAYNGLDFSGTQKQLSDLLDEVDKLNFIKRIRYITSYPTEISDKLIDVHVRSNKIMPLFFVPIQSGSNAILKKMNRRYTAEEYLQMIDRVLNKIPYAKFSSDFIVGFPNETDEDFNKTLEIVERVEFINSFSFKYSKRPGTFAAKMDGQVSNDVATNRLIKLQSLLQSKQLKFNQSLVGRIVPVLFESIAKSNSNLMFGKTEYLQTVLCDLDSSCIGKIKSVEITKADAFTLNGKLIKDEK